MNFKKILALILVIATCCAITAGLTIAYMTDEDEAINVMVVGNINIEQREHDRYGNDFVQNQTLLPIVGSTTQKVHNYPAPANYIDKIVTVKNTGKNDAYVRTFVAIPVYNYEGYDATNASTSILHWNGYSYGDAAPNYPVATWLPNEKVDVPNNWHWGKAGTTNYWPGNTDGWNMFTTTIFGQPYEVYVVTHLEPLKAGEVTAPNLTGVYLDSRVDFDGTNYIIDGKVIDNFDGTVEVLVATQAVQWDPAEDWTAWTSLDAAFGAPAADNHPWTDAVWTDVARTEWYDENATEYEIGTAEELAGFASLVNDKGVDFMGKTVKLTADIDLTGAGWISVGQVDETHDNNGAYSAKNDFNGTFDGQGHTISNLTITHHELGDNNGDGYGTGFFGRVCYQKATIKNVNFDKANVAGHHWTGVVVGGGIVNISNVHVTNSTITCHHLNDNACGDKAGAIIGYLSDGSAKLVDCSATDCTIAAGRDSGQLIGTCTYMANAYENCTATNVSVTYSGNCTGANIKNEIVGRGPAN